MVNPLSSFVGHGASLLAAGRAARKATGGKGWVPRDSLSIDAREREAHGHLLGRSMRATTTALATPQASRNAKGSSVGHHHRIQDCASAAIAITAITATTTAAIDLR
jgi:hypothetical protein